MGREVNNNAGYGRSDAATFTIPSGATGSAVAAVDLERNYMYLMVKCEDASNIAAATNLTAQVGYDDADALVDLYERDDPSTAWSKGSLPTSGSFGFALVHAVGAQRLRLVLSNAASGGDVVFTVYGIGASVAG